MEARPEFAVAAIRSTGPQRFGIFSIVAANGRRIRRRSGPWAQSLRDQRKVAAETSTTTGTLASSR
jgi:hypothetical protein